MLLFLFLSILSSPSSLLAFHSRSFHILALGLLFILIGYFSSKIDTTKSTVSLEWNDKYLEKELQILVVFQ